MKLRSQITLFVSFQASRGLCPDWAAGVCAGVFWSGCSFNVFEFFLFGFSAKLITFVVCFRASHCAQPLLSPWLHNARFLEFLHATWTVCERTYLQCQVKYLKQIQAVFLHKITVELGAHFIITLQVVYLYSTLTLSVKKLRANCASNVTVQIMLL